MVQPEDCIEEGFMGSEEEEEDSWYVDEDESALWYTAYTDRVMVPTPGVSAALGPGIGSDLYTPGRVVFDFEDYVNRAVASTVILRRLEETSMIRVLITAGVVDGVVDGRVVSTKRLLNGVSTYNPHTVTDMLSGGDAQYPTPITTIARVEVRYSLPVPRGGAGMSGWVGCRAAS